MTIINDVELRYITNMLEGNINRMCVTDDIEELKRMKDFALKRINAIYEYQENKLKGE